ncbi:MAG: glycosyltransferase [Firmicutes bacterium]|nr:glycosyltransferase [Bacillota bacterium]
MEVVIPAYNEEATVAGVVKAARACPLVRRVVVIDDGSRDRTAEVAQAAGAEVVRLPQNRGKTAALVAGEMATAAGVLVLLDGDLLGLDPSHLEALAAPVLCGEAAMTIGIFQEGRLLTDLSQRVTPFLNGQRALRRELLMGLHGAERRRYAADTLLSRYARYRRLPVRMVPLRGLTQGMKEEKLGVFKGFLSRLRMFAEVGWAFFATWSRETGVNK